jgi:putative Holliday junction resolvase
MAPKSANNVVGPILAFDLGEKRIGVAISDELLISVRRLEQLKRSNWKQLVKDALALVQRFDAKTVVIGLPLRLDQQADSAAGEVERLAKNLSQSLSIPVYLQDEKLTSIEARERLVAEGLAPAPMRRELDSEAATIILEDFISSLGRDFNPRRI